VLPSGQHGLLDPPPCDDISFGGCPAVAITPEGYGFYFHENPMIFSSYYVFILLFLYIHHIFGMIFTNDPKKNLDISYILFEPWLYLRVPNIL
jgi:hypothetical protein